jgi:hypothetical protein
MTKRVFVFYCFVFFTFSAYAYEKDVSCYAVMGNGDVTIDGVCILYSDDENWEADDEFVLILSPKNIELGQDGYYLFQSKLLGKTYWDASWNGHITATHAQAKLGDDFDIGYDKSNKTSGICWSNESAHICFGNE